MTNMDLTFLERMSPQQRQALLVALLPAGNIGTVPLSTAPAHPSNTTPPVIRPYPGTLAQNVGGQPLSPVPHAGANANPTGINGQFFLLSREMIS